MSGDEMPRYFFDTSAITKHYHGEVGTPRVDSLLAMSGAAFLVTRLAVVEVHSDLAKKVRSGLLTRPNFEKMTRLFHADLRKRVWSTLRLKVVHFQAAERLIRRAGLSKNLRTLDALQLTVALSLNEPSEPVGFVCADQALCEIAMAEGPTVINPEVP
jgi:predicted nucleic acid-binding protein